MRFLVNLQSAVFATAEIEAETLEEAQQKAEAGEWNDLETSEVDLFSYATGWIVDDVEAVEEENVS